MVVGFGCGLGSSESTGNLTLLQASFIFSRQPGRVLAATAGAHQEASSGDKPLSWASVMAFTSGQLKEGTWLSPELGDGADHSAHGGRALRSHKRGRRAR